ncbi:MAG: transporter [Parvularcula sp.]|jgi:hypothetical protein|nr:transporter [Parvularcula sp.]
MKRISGTAATLTVMWAIPACYAQESVERSVEDRLRALEESAATEIEALKRQNEALRRELEDLQGTVQSLSSRPSEEEQKTEPAQKQTPRRRQPEPLRPTTPAPETPEDIPEQVGEAPEEDVIDQPTALFGNFVGVLTPKGTLLAETGINYTTSSDNRFFFSGVEIIDALIIGAIEARDTDRTSISASQTLRFGLTGRLEVDATIPFVQQYDRVANIAIQDPRDSIRDRDGSGLGDISFGLHYQLNQGRRWPVVIANIRGKAPTGSGLFDLDEDEAATGSGYWSVEPSLTFIKRTDPVVLFGNIGYQVNLETDAGLTNIDVVENPQGPDLPPILTTTRTRFIDFDAGDALRTSFGLGIALNERVNLNFGYDQSYIFKSETRTETTRVSVQDGREVGREGPTLSTQEGQETTIGSFLFGVSYRPTRKLRVGVTTGIGATDEAPDVNVSLRSQYAF